MHSIYICGNRQASTRELVDTQMLHWHREEKSVNTSRVTDRLTVVVILRVTTGTEDIGGTGQWCRLVVVVVVVDVL